MSKNIEAVLMAHEAALIALLRSNPNPEEAFTTFNRTYPDMVRNLNQRGTPENTQLATDLAAECGRLALRFPRGKGFGN